MKTISVQLSDDAERQLRERASEKGVTLESYLASLAVRDMRPPMNGNKVLEEEIAWLQNRTDDEINAARARLLGTPVRPLPPGKSLIEAVEGTWPGDETDAQINEILERMS